MPAQPDFWGIFDPLVHNISWVAQVRTKVDTDDVKIIGVVPYYILKQLLFCVVPSCVHLIHKCDFKPYLFTVLWVMVLNQKEQSERSISN